MSNARGVRFAWVNHFRTAVFAGHLSRLLPTGTNTMKYKIYHISLLHSLRNGYATEMMVNYGECMSKS